MKSAAWDAIVVGGGMAGVATAHGIERAIGVGARVLLLEAGSTLGGRTRSRPIGNGRAVDLGAHYFGVKHRRVRALAERLCPEAIFERSAVYGPDPSSRGRFLGEWRVTPRSRTFFDVQGLERNGPLVDRLAIVRSMSLHLALEGLVDVRAPWRTPLARRLDSMTFADWIAAQDIPSWIAEMWRLGPMGILSVPPEEISLLYWLWYQASNGGLLFTSNDYAGGAQEFSLRCGMGGLVERLARELARTEVRTSSPVVRVQHGDPRVVRVELADGTEETARSVVIAAGPQAIHRHVSFEPALDPRRARFHAQRTGHAAKVVLTYLEPFWHRSDGHHVMSWSDGSGGALEWGLDTSDPDGSWFSLMFFVSPALLARLGEGADDRAVERAILEAAVETTGDARAAHPSRIDVEIWSRDPWVGGGPNTVMGKGVLSELGGVLGEPEGPHQRVFFAGAEQSLELTGYVEGALASAEHTVAAVLRSLASRDGIASAAGGRVPRRPRRTSALQLGLGVAVYAITSPALALAKRMHRVVGAAAHD